MNQFARFFTINWLYRHKRGVFRDFARSDSRYGMTDRKDEKGRVANRVAALDRSERIKAQMIVENVMYLCVEID